MLADGVTDMAILGRQLICDPEWANKAKAGREDGLVKSRLGDTTAKPPMTAGTSPCMFPL